MSEQNKGQPKLPIGWIILAALAAIASENLFGVFSGCDMACQRKKDEIAFHKEWDAMTDEQKEQEYQRIQEERWDEYYSR